MKIVLDGYYLAKPRGMGRYAQELLYSLGRYADADLEIHAVVPASMPDEKLILPGRISYRRARSAPFPVWEQAIFPVTAAGLKPDVIHHPYNTKSVVHLSRAPTVVTIHDLMFMKQAEDFSSGWYQRLGNLYRNKIVSNFSKTTHSIITDSIASQLDIQSALNLPSTVIYIPCEYGCRYQGAGGAPQRAVVAGRYLLHVGGASPHKNTERCIQAFLATAQTDCKLVVAGMPGNGGLAQRHTSERVVFPGWLSDEEMTQCYAGAEAIVFPSLMEGYGLPIVEAFTTGVPVITSNRDPMREISADAAVLVDPLSMDDLRTAMETLMHSARQRKELVEKGSARLKCINGRVMSRQIVEIYRALAV